MATPTQPERRLLAAGAKKGATWGTAVALGALDGILLESLSGLLFQRDYTPQKTSDTPFVKSGDLGPIKPVDFTLGGDLQYDPGALGRLFALLFGTAGAPVQQGATAAYKHVLQWADTQYGKFATFAAEYPGKIFEVASAKPLSWELSLSGGLIKSTVKLRGNTLIEDSAINTLTQMDALTYQDRDNRARFLNGSIKMNAQSGADVTAETALEVNALTISFGREGHDAPVLAGQEYIPEPVEGGHPVVKVKLGFPRFNTVNAAFLATFKAHAPQKMLITFTGSIIADAYAYFYKFFFPRLIMQNPEPAWEDIIKNGLELVAEEAAANPTGMSYARPHVEIMNKQTTDYLA